MSGPQTLEDVESALWRQLQHATRDAEHAWRRPVLATVDSRSGVARADARVVVLREVDRDTNVLILYTDSRSGKVGQLQAHPSGTLVFWAPDLNWQLRCRVRLEFDDSGPGVVQRWAAVRAGAGARDYLSQLPPGAPLQGSTPPPLSPQGFFAVITCHIEALDWMEVPPAGHRRAEFSAAGARWLQP